MVPSGLVFLQVPQILKIFLFLDQALRKQPVRMYLLKGVRHCFQQNHENPFLLAIHVGPRPSGTLLGKPNLKNHSINLWSAHNIFVYAI